MNSSRVPKNNCAMTINRKGGVSRHVICGLSNHGLLLVDHSTALSNQAINAIHAVKKRAQHYSQFSWTGKKGKKLH